LIVTGLSSLKTSHALNLDGIAVARCTVERLMRTLGWPGLVAVAGPHHRC
jgi:hypothetical protein